MNLLRRSVGNLAVDVLPSFGGRIYAISYRGFNLLRTPQSLSDSVLDPWFGSSFFMAPWCNRIPAGRFTFAGKDYLVPTNFNDGSAIHGQVHSRAWRVIDNVADRPLRWGVQVDNEFPWSYSVEASLDVSSSVVRIILSLTNLSHSSMPAGVGWHPWFAADSQLVVRTPACMRLLLDDGEESPVETLPSSHATIFDSAKGPTWGRHELYACDGPDPITLTWTEKGFRCSMKTDQANYVLIYAHEETRSIAVEPQTHALDGFYRLENGLPGAMHVLPPGCLITTTITLAVDEIQDDPCLR